MDELTNLIPFVAESGQTIRTATHPDTGQPVVMLQDLCEILGVKNPSQAAQRLDEDEVAKVLMQTRPGDPRNKALVVTEAGFYHLVLTSRSPASTWLRRWVTHDVLPAIRRKGAYLTEKMTREVTSSQASIDRRADAALYEISQAHIIALKQPDARGCQILAQHLVDAALHLAKARQEQGPLLSLIDRPMTQLGAGVADTIRSPEIRKAIGAPTLEQVRAQALAAYAEPVDNN